VYVLKLFLLFNRFAVGVFLDVPTTHFMWLLFYFNPFWSFFGLLNLAPVHSQYVDPGNHRFIPPSPLTINCIYPEYVIPLLGYWLNLEL